MTPSLRDLQYFEVVAEEGQIARAAQRLGRTQPAVTKCIDRLEEVFGSALLERDGRGVRLTPVGAMLFQRARLLRGATEEAVRAVTEFASGSTGLLRLGAGPIAAADLLPEICSAFLRRAPGVKIDVQVASGPTLLDLLRHGQLDIVLGLTPRDDDLVTLPIAKDAVVVAAIASHPVFAERRITLASLVPHGWVLPGISTGSRQWLNVAFEARGLPPPRVQIEANSLPLLPRMIARTGLLSFVSRRVLSADLVDGLEEVPLKETTFHRNFGATIRRQAYLSPTALSLLELLKDEGKTLLRDPSVRRARALS